MATLKEFLKADRFATCAGGTSEIKPGMPVRVWR